MLPRRYLPLAVVTAVASYIVWSLARGANDFSGAASISLIAAIPVLAVPDGARRLRRAGGVDRYRDRH